MNLIEGLPYDCALRRSANEGLAAGWSHAEELLVGLLELTDLGNRNFFKAHSRKGTPEPNPIKISRPWIKRKPATSAELLAFFGPGNVRVSKSKADVDTASDDA